MNFSEKNRLTLPNFLIVGAAKAGTTSLYHYLNSHDKIFFPKLKEPKFFSSAFIKFPQNGIGDNSIDNYRINNWSSYTDLFKSTHNKMIGEASPEYLYYHKNVAPLIRKKLGNIPIIIVLRNPVLRAFSAYSYLLRDNREKYSFKIGLAKESERIKDNWDYIWHYYKAGLYYNQVKTYIENFSRVKIILFEDLIDNPLLSVNGVLDFLNLKKFEKISKTKYNSSGVPKNDIIKFILRRDNKLSLFIRKLLNKTINRKYLEYFSQINLSKLNINENEKKILKEKYSKDIIKLENLTKLKLDIWKEI